MQPYNCAICGKIVDDYNGYVFLNHTEAADARLWNGHVCKNCYEALENTIRKIKKENDFRRKFKNDMDYVNEIRGRYN